MSVTLFIIILTAGVSIMAFNNQELFHKWKLSPYMVVNRKEWYRIFTHAFIHADWVHLFFNLFVLYMFGENTELFMKREFGATQGTFLFLLLYVGGIAFAALPAVIRHGNNVVYSSIGASGAVAGVLFASILFFPLMELMLLILPIPIPAYIFGPLYLAAEYYLDKRGNDNVAHDAHFFGALFGFFFPIAFRPDLFLRFISALI
ncbi:rhomboid family intramembrane serine protease [bacterium SCSIO 12741]|nr:rhomboid family intramembrane serine protease [bacterium SCSIO 12741]